MRGGGSRGSGGECNYRAENASISTRWHSSEELNLKPSPPRHAQSLLSPGLEKVGAAGRNARQYYEAPRKQVCTLPIRSFSPEQLFLPGGS